ncbi:MAG: hypothetical protein AB1468_02300 [Candidatus Micrarchaeota archaeon]
MSTRAKNIQFKFTCAKGSALLFDAFLALILVVMIIYIGSAARASVWERTNAAMANAEKQRAVLTLADYLVKEGIAYEEGGRVYPNLVDTEKFERMDTDALKNKLGLERLGARVESKNFAHAFGGNFSGVCVKRVVFIKGYGVGSLEVCA